LINADGTVNSTLTNWRASEFINVDGLSNVYISGVSNSTASNNGGAWYDNSKNFISYFTMSSVISDGNLSVPANAVYVRFSVVELNINTAQLEAGSTATTYEPYSNICPITGHTGVELTHSGADTSIYETHSVTFPQVQSPVYGGEVDWVNGVLRITKVNIASYNGETLPSVWISDRDVYT
jgi:hypothetical protein